MAKNQLICTIALFFFLITCQMLSAKARHLKSHKNSGHSKTTATKFDIPKTATNQIDDDCSCAAKFVCPPDAHGTSPCHRRSPGHGPCPPCTSPSALGKPTKSNAHATSTDDSHHKTLRASAMAYQTDFRPTAPGSSPGAGHSDTSKDSKEETQQCTNESCINDFRPTAPGDSPGAGHSDTNSDSKEEAQHYSAEKSVDDFRPTAPGDSPGAGHSSTNNSDNDASEHIGVEHPQAAERTIDDYRPTAPGQSPGAGHAITTQQIKPST